MGLPTNCLILSLFVLLALVSESTGLKCYSCDSSTDKKCNDKFMKKGATSKTCADTANKFCKKVKYKKGDVKRSCEAICKEVKVDGGQTTCCNKDECNGAGLIHMSAALVLTSTLLAGYNM